MTNSEKSNGANLGFEDKLWEMADKLEATIKKIWRLVYEYKKNSNNSSPGYSNC